jgi:hypothetical protein
VITIPYAPDFDASAGGWSVIEGDWAWGAPAQTAPLDAAPAGSTNVWMTGLSANYANSRHTVESPIIDASGTSNDLIFTFDLAADVENGGWDEFGMEFSVDGGSTWTEPAPSGAGSWTTDTGSACATVLNAHCWEDDITSWTTFSTVLPGTAGAADLRIRVILEADSGGNGPGVAFDNVSIVEGAAEICDDAGGADEDLDGFANCGDSECSALPECAPGPENFITVDMTAGFCCPTEHQWQILSGATVVYSGSGDGDQADLQLADGCYTFLAIDTFGDGWDGATVSVFDQNAFFHATNFEPTDCIGDDGFGGCDSTQGTFTIAINATCP